MTTLEQQSKKTKLAALGLALCLVAALTLSALFVVTHAEHHCAGENCNICHQIKACVATLHRLSELTILGAAGAFGAILFLFFLLQTVAASSRHSKSLILLKVRLND